MNYFRNDYTTDDANFNVTDPTNSTAFTDMACGISAYFFEGWGKKNNYMSKAVTTWFTERWPGYDDAIIDPDNLENLGYSQWSNGIPTTLLYLTSERSLARSEATSRENENFEHPQGQPHGIFE